MGAKLPEWSCCSTQIPLGAWFRTHSSQCPWPIRGRRSVFSHKSFRKCDSAVIHEFITGFLIHAFGFTKNFSDNQERLRGVA
jgi:hypothetical protein